MIEPKSPVVELQSRLGRVGSIQAWDPWESRKSVKHAKWWVSKIARLSHGLGEAEDFEAHFDRVVNKLHHESVLEFVPMLTFGADKGVSIPEQSWRKFNAFEDLVEEWGSGRGGSLEEDSGEVPASAFLVEAPIFVARQWMRHRSFAYLEMSRRYVKGSKIAWEFYGEFFGAFAAPGTIVLSEDGETLRNGFHEACLAEYQRRLDAGWPNEVARGCMPVEAMTKFWVAGFDRDWEAFLKLRDDDHAQPEIRVFATWIRQYLEGRRVSDGA